MAISFFDKTYFKSCGLSNKVICPECKTEAEMSLFESLDVSGLSLALGKDASEYFAVCPFCSGVFSVNPVFMKEREKGTFCIITSDDLTALNKTNG